MQHAYGAWEALFQYIVQCHNHVNISGDEQGNRRSPIQVVAHRAGTYLCLFVGSLVRAKVLETLQKRRFIPAAYRRIRFSQPHEIVRSEIFLKWILIFWSLKMLVRLLVVVWWWLVVNFAWGAL